MSLKNHNMKQEMNKTEDERKKEELLAIKVGAFYGGQNNQQQKRPWQQQQHRKNYHSLSYKTDLQSIPEFDPETLVALKQRILKENIQREVEEKKKRLRSFGATMAVMSPRPSVLSITSSEKCKKKTTLKQETEQTAFDHRSISSRPLIKEPAGVRTVTRNRANTFPAKLRDIRCCQDVNAMRDWTTLEERADALEIDNINKNLKECTMAEKVGHIEDETHYQYHSKISDKISPSYIFPPLTEQTHYSKQQMKISPREPPSEKILQAETTYDKDPNVTEDLISEECRLKNQALAAMFEEESERLNKKIKDFVAKPIPRLPPSSLKIRRSTIHDIKIGGLSRRFSTEPVPAIERKRSHGVVNMHTSPSINVFTDRSWMYQDRPGHKCRYIRAPQTPIPPINQIFDSEERS